MGRFEGDNEDFPGQWQLWEAALTRSVNGRRGQAALRDLRDALISLPDKRLIKRRLADEQGCVCTLGALALKRRVDAGESRQVVLQSLASLIQGDDDEWDAGEKTLRVGEQIGLSMTMTIELASSNDDVVYRLGSETPEQRYNRVLEHVEKLIV